MRSSLHSEDPDNRGGGMAARGGMHMRPGDDFSAEEIFNMFFAGMGGVPGGGGVHVYTTGFGHGPQFRAPRPQRARNGNLNANQPEPGFGLLLQLLPILLIAAFSFVRFETTEMPQGTMPGESKYFSLRVSMECFQATKNICVCPMPPRLTLVFSALQALCEPLVDALVGCQGHSLLCDGSLPTNV